MDTGDHQLHNDRVMGGKHLIWEIHLFERAERQCGLLAYCLTGWVDHLRAGWKRGSRRRRSCERLENGNTQRAIIFVISFADWSLIWDTPSFHAPIPNKDGWIWVRGAWMLTRGCAAGLCVSTWILVVDKDTSSSWTPRSGNNFITVNARLSWYEDSAGREKLRADNWKFEHNFVSGWLVHFNMSR